MALIPIEQALANIMSAVYGEEVRTSIHDAIFIMSKIAEWHIEDNDPTDIGDYQLGQIWLNNSTYDIYKLQDAGTGPAWTLRGNIKGEEGTPGNGIKNITPVKETGHTKITITLDDDTTYTFDIPDGVNGTDGTDGRDGEDGVGVVDVEELAQQGLVHTFRINLTNGEYYDMHIKDGKDGEGSGNMHTDDYVGSGATRSVHRADYVSNTAVDGSSITLNSSGQMQVDTTHLMTKAEYAANGTSGVVDKANSVTANAVDGTTVDIVNGKIHAIADTTGLMKESEYTGSSATKSVHKTDTINTTSAIGSSTKPVYVDSDGYVKPCDRSIPTKATASELGTVKPDGTSTEVDSSGVLKVKYRVATADLDETGKAECVNADFTTAMSYKVMTSVPRLAPISELAENGKYTVQFKPQSGTVTCKVIGFYI